MIVRHKATGLLSRVILSSYCVKTKKPHVVYVEAETGRVYNRSEASFRKNYEVVQRDPQGSINPKVDY